MYYGSKTDNNDFLEELSINPTYESIKKITSTDTALKLSCAFGGKRIYIPYNITEKSVLSQAIDLEDAAKISEIYGGLDWSVPASQGKKAKILNFLHKGMPVQQIAERMQCSSRHIFRIKAAEKLKNPNTNQSLEGTSNANKHAFI